MNMEIELVSSQQITLIILLALPKTTGSLYANSRVRERYEIEIAKGKNWRCSALTCFDYVVYGDTDCLSQFHRNSQMIFALRSSHSTPECPGSQKSKERDDIDS